MKAIISLVAAAALAGVSHTACASSLRIGTLAKSHASSGDSGSLLRLSSLGSGNSGGKLNLANLPVVGKLEGLASLGGLKGVTNFLPLTTALGQKLSLSGLISSPLLNGGVSTIVPLVTPAISTVLSSGLSFGQVLGSEGVNNFVGLLPFGLLTKLGEPVLGKIFITSDNLGILTVINGFSARIPLSSLTSVGVPLLGIVGI